MKKVFTYSLVFKLLFRYGNIPVTLMLLLYLAPSLLNVDKNPFHLIPVALVLLLIYFINKRYLHLYKIIPYRIEADDEKLECSEFLISRKEFTIYYKDISSLTGGIFSGRLSGLMKVYDDRNKIEIGFYHKINNAKELEKIILSHVDKKIYDAIADRVGLKKNENQ